MIDSVKLLQYNMHMERLRFAWDPDKNSRNVRDHGISFEEAQTVFQDEYARLRDDPDHSDDEDRFLLLGMSRYSQLLVVCHCYRESETVIRIISARTATRRERRQYEGFRI